MVRKLAENGTYYHEPPYTWEEQQDFYRRVASGPFTVLRGTPQERKDPPEPEGKQTPS